MCTQVILSPTELLDRMTIIAEAVYCFTTAGLRLWASVGRAGGGSNTVSRLKTHCIENSPQVKVPLKYLGFLLLLSS